MVPASGDYAVNLVDPDLIVDWELIEQVVRSFFSCKWFWVVAYGSCIFYIICILACEMSRDAIVSNLPLSTYGRYVVDKNFFHYGRSKQAHSSAANSYLPVLDW